MEDKQGLLLKEKIQLLLDAMLDLEIKTLNVLLLEEVLDKFIKP